VLADLDLLLIRKFSAAVDLQHPASLRNQLTVVSNTATGYAISIHRSAFSPADLRLAVGTAAPTGGAPGAG